MPAVRHRSSSIPRRMILGLAVMGFVVACTGQQGSRVTTSPCGPSQRLQDYIDEIAVLASHASRPHEVPAREAVTLRLRLSGGGRVREAEVVKATSEETAAWGLTAIHAGAPYPAPLPGLRSCVVNRPFLVWLVSLGPETARNATTP